MSVNYVAIRVHYSITIITYSEKFCRCRVNNFFMNKNFKITDINIQASLQFVFQLRLFRLPRFISEMKLYTAHEDI